MCIRDSLIPHITVQPKKVSSCPGYTATFSITATGDSLNYQWMKNGVIMPGKISSSLTINPVTYSDTATYTCLVTNTCGSELSVPAKLTINIPPVITVQPHKISTCIGNSITLNITATGDSLYYQWKFNGTNIPGAIASSLTINPVHYSDTGYYSCYVYNTCGSVLSQQAHVTVNIAPVIIQQPVNISTCQGENVSFSVIATGDSLFYQWKKNGFDIPGATQNTLIFNPVSYADTASYSCLVYNTCNTVLSNTAYLNINIPPVIQNQPLSLLTCVGDIDFFHIDVTGDSLFYQWRFEESNIAGATSQDYLINPVTLADIGVYDVIVWNTCGTVVSDTAHLYANIDPAVIVDPQNISSCLGQTESFVVGILAAGSALPNFQWYKDGLAITGANDSVLTISNISLAKTGAYFCELSNNCDTVYTDTVQLTAVSYTHLTLPTIYSV